MRINAGTARSVAVSTVAVLTGSITAAPVLLPLGDLAVRQAALVLAASASCPWVSRSVAGSVLAGARKARS